MVCESGGKEGDTVPGAGDSYKKAWEFLNIREHQKGKAAKRLQDDYRVFLSYSHADRDVARSLKDTLDQSRIHYVVDDKDMEWGDEISERVEELLKGCTHYLLILSENSINSQWCAFEYGFAKGQGNEVLLFLASEDVNLPNSFSHHLATADRDRVEEYFSRDIIDTEEVEEFVAEILQDHKARLEDFRKVEAGQGRPTAWEAPYGNDREANRTHRLVRIELDGEEPLVLSYGALDRQPERYSLRHNQEWNAVVIEPEPPRTDAVTIVRMREVTEEGEVRHRHSDQSVKDRLDRNADRIWGWEGTSRGFWEAALRTLRTKLPN
jgi:hypothetical protein